MEDLDAKIDEDLGTFFDKYKNRTISGDEATRVIESLAAELLCTGMKMQIILGATGKRGLGVVEETPENLAIAKAMNAFVIAIGTAKEFARPVATRTDEA